MKFTVYTDLGDFMDVSAKDKHEAENKVLSYTCGRAKIIFVEKS